MLHNVKPIWFLLTGILVLSAAHNALGINVLGWIASVPFLMYLRRTQGFRSRLFFVSALLVAWSLSFLKIITPPIPFLFDLLFSVPITLFHLAGYLLWDRFKNRSWSAFLFPATMAIIEWIQYTFTPFASWAVAAYTQSNNIALMLVLSLFGMPGLSFLVYWMNISIAETLIQGRITRLVKIPLVVLSILMIFGSLRYEIGKSKGVETMTLAAVGSDSDVGGFPLPSKAINDKVIADLFKRTTSAAKSGAKLVVWNEASTFILPEEEAQWRDSLTALAARLHIAIVPSFVVPLSEKPMKYENKYYFIDSSGTVLYTYNKHQPVPGEPADPGKEPLRVFNIAGANVGAAICYDYDFPYLARGYGKLNADIVALPSSDWRGIDPLHSKMAALRAVEQGHAILRSTRFGLSAAITPYGEMTAQMSSFDGNDKIMLAHLPVKGLTTLYSIIGDVFIYLCIVFVFVFLFQNFRPARPVV